MQQKPRVAVIIGSTRDSRFADKPANWIFELARERADWQTELVDIRDFDLPLFNERASNMWMPSADPRAVAWQEKLDGFDAFIFVTSEYNRSVPGSLKNALDQAYKEWIRKPAAVVAYGSVGGARAAEHLRTIAIELQMVPTRFGVHIQGADFMQVHPMGKNAAMSEIEDNILPGAKAMLDDLDWWTRATMAARARIAETVA